MKNGSRKIALVGNPNCGKSSLFNVLTGLRQKVGNYPGVTIDRKVGTITLPDNSTGTLIDLPGANSLYPSAEDERITCKILRDQQHPDHPDLCVMVVDGTQLKRSLLLCSQLIDLGLPTILVLNMTDLVKKEGILIDQERLSEALDIPVVAVSALKETGIAQLKQALIESPEPSSIKVMTVPYGLNTSLDQIKKILNTENDYLAYQAWLKPDQFPQLTPYKYVLEQAGMDSDALIGNELLVRYDRINQLLSGVLLGKEDKPMIMARKWDRVFLHRVWGYAVFAAILLLIFQALFSLAAYPMDAIDAGFGITGNWLEKVLPDGFFSDLLIEGVWAGLGGIVIFIPQIAFLFFFIAVLEETGYMSRVVFLMDRIMRPFGFSGRSVIPLIGGMACAVPSIMMTRSIPHAKERLITIMVTPLMSCSARIPVYVLLIAMMVPATPVLGIFTLQGVVMMGFYLLGFAMALAVAYVFKRVLGYQNTGIFVTEMPVYRMPRWRNVAITMYQKSKTFVVEAGKIIMIVSIILWLLAAFAPGNAFQEIDQRYDQQLAQTNLDATEQLAIERERSAEKLQSSYAGRLGKIIEPVIKPLGFDWKIGISLIASFAAREVFVGTMATIYSLEGAEEDEGLGSLRQRMLAETDEDGNKVYTPIVALSLLMFYAFAMQCMSTLAITKKETGSWKLTFVMLTYLTALAYVASLITYQVFS